MINSVILKAIWKTHLVYICQRNFQTSNQLSGLLLIQQKEAELEKATSQERKFIYIFIHISQSRGYSTSTIVGVFVTLINCHNNQLNMGIQNIFQRQCIHFLANITVKQAGLSCAKLSTVSATYSFALSYVAYIKTAYCFPLCFSRFS